MDQADRIALQNASQVMANAANIMARCARTQGRIVGMQAENEYRNLRGEAQAYPEEAFLKVIEEEGVGQNSVIGTLYQGMI